MARIRSIKPEFCTSLDIADLSLLCQLHFVRLWTHCDDAGRCLDEPRLVKAAVWPVQDDVTLAMVEAFHAELEEKGRIVRYEHNGRPYLEVRNWGNHQKPNRPVPSKYPAPEERTEPSRTTHGALTEDAVSQQGALTPVVVEGDVEGDVVGEGDVESDKSDVSSVFAEWVNVTGRTNRTVLDDKRRRTIQRALKSHGYETCIEAVRGWLNSPFHRGENSSGAVYDDITLILRDAQKIEGFARLYHEPARPRGQSRRYEHEQALTSEAERFLAVEHSEHEELTSGVA